MWATLVQWLVSGTPIRHCKGYCGVVVGVWDSYKAL